MQITVAVPFGVAVSDRKSAIKLSFHVSPASYIHATGRHFLKRRGLVFLKIFDGNFDLARVTRARAVSSDPEMIQHPIIYQCIRVDVESLDCEM
jgi:hypothetical protein